MNRRFFTVDEATALLPEVENAIRTVKEGSDRLSELSHMLFEGGKPEAETLVDSEYTAGVIAMQKGVETIHELGAEVKDFSSGLVDFPSLRSGREVNLCWMLGEDHIAFWHELDSGFSGRTAIENIKEFEGGTIEESAS